MLQTNFEIGLFNGYILFSIYFMISILHVFFKKKEKYIGEEFKDDFFKVIYWLHLVVFFLAFFITFFLPMIIDSIYFYIGIILWIIGIIIYIFVFISWRKKPKDKPILTGIYKYSRNPMYLSYICAYVGIGIATVSWIFLVLTATYVFFTILFVDYEERYLLRIYGEDYKNYLKKTPRWLGVSKK